jgi:hypothetical protein
MKMISRQSITSIYGTTLISDFSLRAPRLPRMLLEKEEAIFSFAF